MKTLRESYLYAIYTAIVGWFSGQWKNSALVAWMTGQSPVGTGFLDRFFGRLRSVYCSVFEKLRLPELLRGSVFMKPTVFCAAAVILAPLCPTMLILAFVCAGFFSLLLKLGADRGFTLQKSPLGRYVALYGAIYLYATMTSVSLSGSLYSGLLTIAFVLFFFAVTSCGFFGKKLDLLVAALLMAGVAVSAYGFYQFLFPEKFRNVWTDTDMFSSIAFRVYSTLENPNVLGEYFLLVIPLACAAVLTADTRSKRLAALAAVGVMVLCLIMTYSRGCYLGLLFAAVVFLVLLNPKLLIPAAVALLLCPLYLPESVVSRFTSIGNMGDSSTSYRVYIWMGTLAMLKDYWFCGVGPGVDAYNVVYPEYAYNAVTAPHSHSLYLQLICDTGICGLAVFLLLVVAFYRMMFTAIRRERDRKARIFQIAGVSSVTGFLVQGATDFTFYNYRVLLLFWVLLALCVLFTRMGTAVDTCIGEEAHD